MKNIGLFFIVALGLIAAGCAEYYFYGYKDSLWIQGTSYCLVIFGWLSLMFFFGALHIRIKEQQKANNNFLLKIGNIFFFLLYPVGLVGLIAGLVILENKKNERVEHVLSTGNVSLTTARVVRVEQRRIKSTSHIYAVIEYNAAGKKVEQAIKDDQRLYRQGQEINIKYSMDYPDMFVTIAELNPRLQY